MKDSGEKSGKKHRLLMCRPDHYQVIYEINPWMNLRRPADKEKAHQQWEEYFRLLTRELQVEVELIEPVRLLPDMVFTANAGIARKKIFIRSNFRHAERMKEEVHFEKWFRRTGYKVQTLERPLCFEGEGDALFLGDELYTGYHFRSDLESHDVVASYLKCSYQALELKDKRFYHLDTCFAPLNAKAALAYLGAFETYAQMALVETVEDLIRVPEEEALHFACNALVLDSAVILPLGCPQTMRELKKRSFEVYEIDFSEFMKAGGAAKCLALKLE